MGESYSVPTVEPGLDAIWVAQCTFLIFLMQLGFSFVEAGTVRFKNIHSILMKNILDVCIGTISWWLIGYSFAFGESRGGFMGSSEKLYAGNSISKLHWMNQWAFASTATTIISGAVAERLKISGYMIFCIIMTMFIYPIQVHWVWGQEGWLNELGFHDFAGTNAVHMVGGIAGLVATKMIGQRIGRFEDSRSNEFKPSSIPFVVLGTILLWFCWYGFNCGTVTGFSDDIVKTTELIGDVGLNTTLGAVGGALSCFFVSQLLEDKIQRQGDVKFGQFIMARIQRIDSNEGTNNICMGILAGLVSITGCCDSIDPWAAFVTGIIGGIFYVLYSKGIKKYKIDDPLDASSIHFACGVWGGIATGFFNKDKGVFYGGDLIGVQILGILAICAWTVGFSVIILLLLRKFKILRCSAVHELVGFDNIFRDDEKGDTLLNIVVKLLQAQGSQGPYFGNFEQEPRPSQQRNSNGNNVPHNQISNQHYQQQQQDQQMQQSQENQNVNLNSLANGNIQNAIQIELPSTN